MPDYKLTDVDSSQIENVSRSIDADIKELLSIKAVFENGVMAELNPYWQGQAKQSFEQQFSAFAELYIKLVEGYSELNEQLKNAGTGYSEADELVKQLIAKLL